jgi:FkbM family methyltransferase
MNLLGKVVHRVRREIATVVLGALFEPRLSATPHNHKLIRLGSAYGGWTLIDSPRLQGSTIFSCGLGEDASFDVEIASKYGARVIVVDPTPRSLAHFERIVQRFGHAGTAEYNESGNQPPAAYDLETVSTTNLELCATALWNESRTMRFYSPPNANHVSHSIGNIQNRGRTDTPYIEVQAATLTELMRTYQCAHIELLKLDIEGAEIEVVDQMLRDGIRPTQVLIEYDELLFPSKRSQIRVERCHSQLLGAGYRLLNIE